MYGRSLTPAAGAAATLPLTGSPALGAAAIGAGLVLSGVLLYRSARNRNRKHDDE